MIRLAGWLLLLTIPATGQCDSYPFDRVFTSAGERGVLDRLVASGELEEQSPEPKAEQAAAAEALSPLDTLTFSGIVVGPGSLSRFWINGRSELSSGAVPPFRPVSIGRDGARFTIDGQRVSLKPGQSIMLESGLVLDPWQSPGDVVAKSDAN